MSDTIPKTGKCVVITLVRHGQSTTNVDLINDASHKGDSPLTAYGLSQAKRLGEEFARVPIDHIYASSLDRAIKTAQAIVDAHEGEPLNLQIDPELREQELGHDYWQALQYGQRRLAWEIKAGPHASYSRLYRPEGGGESYADVSDRARRVLEKLISLHGIVIDSIPEGLDSKSLDPPAGIPHIVLVSHNIFIGEFHDWFLNWNLLGTEWRESGRHWTNASWSRHVVWLSDHSIRGELKFLNLCYRQK